MRKSFKRSTMLVSLFVAFVMLLSAIPVSFAAATTASSVNKKVYISGNSYVQLTDASLIPSVNGATASFTFEFYNGSSNPINLVDYWARLKTKSGTKYTLTLLDKANKKTVSPKSSTTLTFYSAVGSKVTMDQLILNFVKFDFSVSGYEKTIGQFTFPAGYTNDVKAGGYRAVKVGGSSVNMRVNKTTVGKTVDNYSVNLTYVARNTSQFGVNLPEYNYYIKTSVGLYKLTLKDTADQNLLLAPSVLNTIELTGSIPNTVSTSGWKFIVTQKITAADNTQVELPVVSFVTPVSVGNTSTGTAKQTFTDANGTYNVELQSVQRMPWNNEDNVVAKLAVKNSGTTYLPLPDLTGTMLLDDSITLTSQTVKNAGDISIAPGATTTMTFIGKLQTGYNWKKFKLQLNEKSGNDTVDVAEVTKSDVTPIYSVSSGSVYTQKSIGSEMSVKVTDVRTYSGDTNDLYAVYLDVTNNQSRSKTMPQWSGYFKSANGNYYDVTFVKTAATISPGYKEQVIAYTQLPSNVSREGLQLLMGEAIDTNGLLKGATGNPTGYIRGVLFGLPAETATNSNKGIKIGPYTVDLTQFTIFVQNELNVVINLASTVSRDYNYDGFTQSKLQYELVYEPTGDVLWTQNVSLEGKADNSLQWKVGNNMNEITQTQKENKYWSSYTLNVYEVLNGNKKKLFSKDVKFAPSYNWLDETNN
ncbi:hypothetical protein [Paenibacillus sp. JDR-2]|uniref:hypothetical protein n=1 Tax=Paenibacillus sp. (strain JDR-2) TaxID=324057 RepID=UPI0001667CB3|nr:hypothetical protein [Paenibacillus sp. JDR-2]ACT04386.1 hypothetical protein Pjdr2_5780 [Paenibacillus sp. JDR-2]